MHRKPLPDPITGQGELLLGREFSVVTYSYRLSTSGVSAGSLRGGREHVRAAFSRGDGKLRQADGSELELRFMGHTSGSDEVFFEVVQRR